MAIGLCKLNKNQRKSLRSIFYVLNIIEVLIGATITGVSIYVCVAISPTVISDKAEINFVFIVYAIFGTNIMINWLIGLKICNKCINQAHKKSTNNLLLLWYCTGTNTVITLIIMANFTRKVNKHIAKSIKNSIQGDMESYLSDPESKEAIDGIQYELECCGYDSYKDWYDVEWLSNDIVNTKASLVQEIRFGSEKLNLPIVPFSCCKIDYPLQCLHDPLQQTEFMNVWVDQPNTITDSLNTVGCVEKIKRPIEQVVDGFLMVVSAVTFFHVIIIVLSRLLYTSARNAILLCDPEGVAPGWIFGRGDCGYARGKTLTELMGITNEILEKRIVDKKWKGKIRSRGITSGKSTESDLYGQTAGFKITKLFAGPKKAGVRKREYVLVEEDEIRRDTNLGSEAFTKH